MPNRQQAWQDLVRRLDAAYSVGGTEALGKMTGIESYVLYAEKMAQLRSVSKGLARHPHDELAQLRKEKLERETAQICGWMKANTCGLDLDRG